MPVIDYYKQCEDGLIAVVTTLNSFITTPSKQIVTGDDSNLEAGFEYFFNFKPGAFGPTNVAAQQNFAVWEIDLDLLVRFSELATTWEHFRNFRAAVYYTGLLYPSLNGVPGVDHWELSAPAKPQYIQDEEETTIFFIVQTLSAIVTQKIGIPNEGEFNG